MRKSVAIALATVAAVGTSVLGVTTAEGSTKSNKCTVTPLKPHVHPNLHSSGRKQVVFRVTVTCTETSKVDITHRLMEDDFPIPPFDPGDDTLRTYKERLSVPGGSTVTLTPIYVDPTTDTDGGEELFSRVHFRVIRNGVTGGWTAWEEGPIRNYYH
jgi:hypothetical protein